MNALLQYRNIWSLVSITLPFLRYFSEVAHPLLEQGNESTASFTVLAKFGWLPLDRRRHGLKSMMKGHMSSFELLNFLAEPVFTLI